MLPRRLRYNTSQLRNPQHTPCFPITTTASGDMMTAFLARSEAPSRGRTRTKQAKPPPCKFSCTHCKATFNRAAHLRRHDKTHQNDKPYKCELCPVSSSRKDVILRHTRNFHPEIASASAEDDPGPTSDAEDIEPSVNASLPSSASPRSAPANPAPWALPSPGDPEQIGDSPETPVSQPLLTEDVNNLENYLPVPETQLLEPELYANEVTGTSGITLPDHEMLDFLATSDLPMPNTWGIFASETTPVLNPAEFLSNWERDAPVTALVEPLPPGSPASYSHDSPCWSCFSLTDDEYEKIVADLAESDPSGTLSQFRFPSKHAVIRFVKAFFKHMAPQFPVLHPPTFAVISAPLPLLVEIMACGAMYSRERRTAEKLHRVAIQLCSEHWKRGGKTQLWWLQANLLLAFFEMYNADWKVPQRGMALLSETAKIAHEAYSAMKGLSKSNYKNWVSLESTIRCMAGAIVIGATLNSTMKEEYFKVLGMDFDFTLPAMNSEWMKNESEWEQPVDAPNISDTMRLIHAGKTYDPSLSEFGLLTIMSTFLGHVSSFELLTGSRHPRLWTAFVTEMSGPVQVLDELCKNASACMSENSTTHSPLLKTARALLDSIYYHLYGSSQLLIMKELLACPEILVDSESFKQLLRASSTTNFDKAIKRAAKVFLQETRQGLQYLGNLEASHFGPVSTTAVFERGLLLCCYLQTRRSHSPTTSSQSPLDALISEGITEVESQQVSDYKYRISAIPLLASSMILRDASVWKWPPVVSSKLDALIEKLNLLS
ncbi:Hypothetical protein NCS54_00888400 [Fusarium falciforme]|uniref:Hypothetical protein n=1 Tax=Fusarium falciforme TaxID=195108 RepID=UPI0022FFE356|nr:Hypothetical protein NCS54_00888400 [Fusarium falciforme]WAO91415.1 Hypothetical protein NCS54_00888400 [Fusarium falciforme]